VPKPTISAAPNNKKPATKSSTPQQKQPGPSDLLTTARQELFEAQRSRAELQDKLAKKSNELDTLRKRFTSDSKRMAALSADRTHLQLKLKDRDEELRGKAKLLDVSFLAESGLCSPFRYAC
jgi:peptidoglycan hydrolase CwlO-like protein